MNWQAKIKVAFTAMLFHPDTFEEIYLFPNKMVRWPVSLRPFSLKEKFPHTKSNISNSIFHCRKQENKSELLLDININFFSKKKLYHRFSWNSNLCKLVYHSLFFIKKIHDTTFKSLTFTGIFLFLIERHKIAIKLMFSTVCVIDRSEANVLKKYKKSICKITRLFAIRTRTNAPFYNAICLFFLQKILNLKRICQFEIQCFFLYKKFYIIRL